jgi:hypothetical protein
MADRPSRRPTRKMARVSERQVPAAPAVPTFTGEDKTPEAGRTAVKRGSRQTDSLTLPRSSAVPKLIVAPDDLPWFNLDEQVQGILALIDGVRTIAEIARRTATSVGELQLRIADLRDRGVIQVE